MTTMATIATMISTARIHSPSVTSSRRWRLSSGRALCDRRRRLALVPGPRWQPADPATSDQAADEARQALAGIVAQQPCTAHSLALGLLAFHAQLPATISVNDDARARAVLVQASADAIAPLAGLAEAIQTYFAGVHAGQA